MAGGYIGNPGPATIPSSPGVWPIDEVYSNVKDGVWPSGFDVFGGTITQYTNPTGTYRVHTLTSSGTIEYVSLPVPFKPTFTYLLVSAGGGGQNGTTVPPGAIRGGGAGGAGATRTGPLPTASAWVGTVTIGTGGPVGGNGGASNVTGIPGLSIPTPGGGGGSGVVYYKYNFIKTGTGGSSGSPTPFPGQTGSSYPVGSGSVSGGGGGGDAGAASGATGGIGTAYSITGSSVTYGIGGPATSPAATTYGNGGRAGYPSGATTGRPGVFIVSYRIA